MDPRLARLLDRRAIEDVLHEYCRGIDRLDLDRVRGCYHDDATDEHGSFSGSVDAYLEWVWPLLERYRFTMHFLSNVSIDFDAGGTTAACESYGLALHRSDEAAAHLNLATGFRFLDRFERRNEAWRIARRRAVTEWSLEVPAEGWWPVPAGFLQGRRDAEDPLYALLSEVEA